MGRFGATFITFFHRPWSVPKHMTAKIICPGWAEAEERGRGWRRRNKFLLRQSRHFHARHEKRWDRRVRIVITINLTRRQININITTPPPSLQVFPSFGRCACNLKSCDSCHLIKFDRKVSRFSDRGRKRQDAGFTQPINMQEWLFLMLGVVTVACQCIQS